MSTKSFSTHKCHCKAYHCVRFYMFAVFSILRFDLEGNDIYVSLEVDGQTGSFQRACVSMHIHLHACLRVTATSTGRPADICLARVCNPK